MFGIHSFGNWIQHWLPPCSRAQQNHPYDVTQKKSHLYVTVNRGNSSRASRRGSAPSKWSARPEASDNIILQQIPDSQPKLHKHLCCYDSKSRSRHQRQQRGFWGPRDTEYRTTQKLDRSACRGLKSMLKLISIWFPSTGMSEFKLIFLNRQSSSQNICNELLEIFRYGYTQYPQSNRAHHKI
jgi:hypothetical protein